MILKHALSLFQGYLKALPISYKRQTHFYDYKTTLIERLRHLVRIIPWSLKLVDESGPVHERSLL